MNMQRIAALVVALVALATPRATAQNVFLLGSKQGLSNSRVRNITEDSRHNIWITTQNGLNRFDGVKLNVYRHEIGNPHSLVNDEVTCVFELDPYHLIVGSGRGVQMYDYATDRFTTIPIVSAEGDTITSRCISISRVQRDRVIVCLAGYGHGELRTDTKGDPFVRHSLEFASGERQYSPIQMEQDRQGRLWILNSNYDLVRRQGRDFIAYPLRTVRRICMSSSGRFYAVTERDGLFVYNQKTDHFDQVASAADLGGPVHSLNPWTAGRLLVSTDGGGLRVWDERTQRITLSTITTKEFDFSTANVYDAIADSFGNVWAGIYLKGVMMKPVNQSSFEYIGQNSITKNTIGQNSITAISRAFDPSPYQRAMWVAADNDGLYLLEDSGLRSTHISPKTHPGMPQAFTSVLSLTPQVTLLGTFNDGLWQMRGRTISRLSTDISQIFDLQPAQTPDCFWVGTMGQGLWFYNLETGQATNYQPTYGVRGGTDIIGNLYVYSLLSLRGQLWIGTSDGLNVAFPNGQDQLVQPSKKLLERQVIRHMALGNDGRTVWVGTAAGLVKVDRNTFETRTYTTADGLPNNNVAAICVDAHNLWVSTDFGLTCFNTQDSTFTNFYADDGLQDNEFTRGTVLAMEGRIYLGGIGGITYFDRSRINPATPAGRTLRLRMVDLFVGGRTIHKGDRSDGYEILSGILDEVGRIDLGYTDPHFTVELHVMGLTGQHVTYEYSINGGVWTTQDGSNGRLVFDNLKPGTYHIRLRAHAFGTVSPERELLAVIHPVWWQSAWAKLIYLALFLLVCWLVYQYLRRQLHLRRMEQRQRQQDELNEARIQFFMNISHEIRTPMTLILAPLERLLSSDQDQKRQRSYKLIQQNAKRILQLINQMMDVRKIEQGKFLLNRRQVELVGFLQNIYEVFASNAQSRGISYTFLHSDINRLPVCVDPDNTDKIVMNLLSNAFKFTPDGGVITLELTPATLADGTEGFAFSVTDSGVGIADDIKPHVFERFYSGKHQPGYIGTGIGLNLASMLAKLHGGKITVADNPHGHGTQFTVTMPIGIEPEPTPKGGGEAPASVITAMAAELAGVAPLINPDAPAADAQQDDTKAVTSEGEEREGAPLPTSAIPPAPNYDTDADAEQARLLAISKPADTHRRNCLLVEDDEAIRQYVHSELSSDLLIHPCANGQEAWDYIVGHPGKVDIIISDIMMPVMDGMTLCQKLKANFNTNHIPVVLMTALGSDADRIAGISNGADAYVSKPFNIDVLRTTVLQLLKSRQMLQGKFHGDRQQEEKIDHVELESPDEHLMKRVMRVINENMDNCDLSVEIIADKVGISRVHFYRKMKDLTGQAPRDFVKYVRLKEAARLLSEKKLDITGVSIATGFKTLSAFSTSFKALYGMTPTEWVKRAQDSEAGQ